MNCETACDHLSAYHDGELSAETAERLSEHLADCSVCREELAGYQALSDLAGSLSDPGTPPAWLAIEATLTGQPPQALARRASFSGKPAKRRRMVVVTSLTAMIAIAVVWFFSPGETHDHGEHLAVNFDRYLTLFPEQPAQAQQVLVSHYRGKAVTIPQAAQRLPYRPLAAASPPPGYELDSVYLLNMPCCQCLQTIYTDQAGGRLALFEHEADQPIWFGKRPALTAECAGMACRIVQFDSRLAVTCPLGPRYATIVGVRDLQEIVRIVEYYKSPPDQLTWQKRPRRH